MEKGSVVEVVEVVVEVAVEAVVEAAVEAPGRSIQAPALVGVLDQEQTNNSDAIGRSN